MSPDCNAPCSGSLALPGGAMYFLETVIGRTISHYTILEQPEYLLSIPSEISVPCLRIDPTWNSLRGDPAFQKLVEVDPPLH
jgi:hypothetical protein